MSPILLRLDYVCQHVSLAWRLIFLNPSCVAFWIRATPRTRLRHGIVMQSLANGPAASSTVRSHPQHLFNVKSSSSLAQDLL